MFFRRWSVEETKLLKSEYPKYGLIHCSHLLGRPFGSITNRAHKLGLVGGGRKLWTEEEVDYLERFYPDSSRSREEMMRHLGRSWQNIMRAASLRGIRMPKLQRKKGARVYQKRMRERLIKIRGHQCEIANCGWTTTLELHHKDGNRENNTDDNLQLLCPNHHSVTSEYCFPKKYRTH